MEPNSETFFLIKLKEEPLALPKEKGLNESFPHRERATWPPPNASTLWTTSPNTLQMMGQSSPQPLPPIDLFPVKNYHMKHAVENLLKWCHESTLIKCVYLSPTMRFSLPKNHIASCLKPRERVQPILRPGSSLRNLLLILPDVNG